MESTQTALVLDALTALLTNALPTVEVIDGQPLSSQLNNPDVLVVGYSPGRASVEVTQERSDMAGVRRQETLSIVCLASAWRGETEMAAARARVVQMLDEVRDVLTANRSLAGQVRRSELGFEMAIDQVQSGDGVTVTAEFSLMVTTL